MRGDFAFFHSLRVRWAEVDRQDVVFNGNYLLYFDVAITEYWRALIAGQEAKYREQMAGWMQCLYVVKAAVEYHGSAHFDDELQIGMRLARVGRSSMRFVPEIYRGGEHLVTGELIYVYKDPASGVPAPVPAELRALMLAFEKTPPEGN
ncbi:MAG TPA: thioesterase family protein [Burkholderiales bacterium]|jgi:YbgC/YbaW family acyl-CoA thioester hydrolase|nr:thioesterase family protein [Burkholderiales bacterium]